MYVRGLLTWILVWFLAFAVNAVLLHLGVILHGSYGSSLILASRDLLVLALSFWLWARWFPARRAAQSWRWSRLDQILLGVASLVTLAFYLRLLDIGEISQPASAQIIDQLQFRTPPRILTLAAFQQVLTTLFLLDLNRQRWGEQKGLLVSAAIFAGSHLFGVLINNPPIYALLITPACLVGFWFWGTARVRWSSPWTPLLTHYLFYLSALLGKAWQWF